MFHVKHGPKITQAYGPGSWSDGYRARKGVTMSDQERSYSEAEVREREKKAFQCGMSQASEYPEEWVSTQLGGEMWDYWREARSYLE